MKPTAYLYPLYKDTPNERSQVTTVHPHKYDARIADITPLYTAHEIADFIRGLYSDDNFRPRMAVSIFTDIADKIEETTRQSPRKADSS